MEWPSSPGADLLDNSVPGSPGSQYSGILDTSSSNLGHGEEESAALSSTQESLVSTTDLCPPAARLGVTDEVLTAEHRNRTILDPMAPEFVPGCRYAPAAPKLSVTEEILGTAGKDAGTNSRIFDPTEPVSALADQRLHDEGRPPLMEGKTGGFATSTPQRRETRGRPRLQHSPVRARGPRLTARDWSFMPGRRNCRRRRNLNRKINYSDKGHITPPEEINKKRTCLRWRATKPRNLKFVDEGITLSKVNMDGASLDGVTDGGKPVKIRQDLQSQNVFRRVVAKAESRGMVVNKRKTKILCISDAQTYKVKTYIQERSCTRGRP